MLRTKRPSVYLLMHGLLDRGVEPGTASTAIDCVLGPDPGRALEHWEAEDGLAADEHPIDDLADEWEPSEEDQAFRLEWSREVEERLLEARMISDYDDLMEAASMLTDADAMAAGVAIG